MYPTLNKQSGLLPLGRYGATLDDIKLHFVDDARFSASATRTAIWNDFESATASIRSAVPLVCVWIGGSFLTDKIDPDDIDLVYWCHDARMNQVADPQDREFLQLIAHNHIRAETGLRVDTRFGIWHLNPSTGGRNSSEDKSYLEKRGFWDDFWMRKRSGDKTSPPQIEDALPRRGYFEIALDGFDGV